MNIFIVGYEIHTAWYGKLKISGKHRMCCRVLGTGWLPIEVRKFGQMTCRAEMTGIGVVLKHPVDMDGVEGMQVQNRDNIFSMVCQLIHLPQN